MENTAKNRGILFIDTHCSKAFSLGFATYENGNEFHENFDSKSKKPQFSEYISGTDPSVEFFDKLEILLRNFYHKNFNEILHSRQGILAKIAGICIVKGPGSLTGLRIGSSIALGLSMGLKIAITAVSIWDLLLKKHPKSHVFFYTGTKKWMYKTGQNSGVYEAIATVAKHEQNSEVYEAIANVAKHEQNGGVYEATKDVISGQNGGDYEAQQKQNDKKIGDILEKDQIENLIISQNLTWISNNPEKLFVKNSPENAQNFEKTSQKICKKNPTENSDQNFDQISYQFDQKPFQNPPKWPKNIPYPNIIELLPENLNLASSDLNLIYNITTF